VLAAGRPSVWWSHRGEQGFAEAGERRAATPDFEGDIARYASSDKGNTVGTGFEDEVERRRLGIYCEADDEPLVTIA
jgi:hypothetical protein